MKRTRVAMTEKLFDDGAENREKGEEKSKLLNLVTFWASLLRSGTFLDTLLLWWVKIGQWSEYY